MSFLVRRQGCYQEGLAKVPVLILIRTHDNQRAVPTLQCGRALRVWFKKSQPKNEGPIIEKEEEEKDEAISVPAAIKKKRRSKCEATEEVQPTWTFSAQKKNRGCASIEQLIAQPCPYTAARKNKNIVVDRARNRKRELDERNQNERNFQWRPLRNTAKRNRSLRACV